VIRNFVSNAIKFSPRDSIIELKSESNEKEWSLAVKDHGMGMSEEVLHNLFDPVHHPSKRGTNNEKGTGLGLRLVKKLVEMHNGRIVVSSKEGEEAIFKVVLPNRS
tara:strand:- start:101292 stop:101609 length:318 start_codon:yes stop_codon:yes gene_type:complete